MLHKKNIKSRYLTKAQQEYITNMLGVPAEELDARRVGVTEEWLWKLFVLAIVKEKFKGGI